MKLRTSFFNGSVLKKDITRFAPVWGLYLIYLLLRLALNRITIVIPLLIYAIVCAITLFGDLYNSRRCNALHAMPMRREGWFLTHGIAGFLFFLIPTAIYILLPLLYYPEASTFLLTSFCAVTLVFFIFYGIALLCVMLAGSRLSAVIMYAVLLSILPMVIWIFQRLYQPFLPGVYIHTEIFRQLQLVTRLQEALPSGQFAHALDGNGNNITHYTVHTDWQYLLICAGISLLLTGLALLLYRKRKLEQSGNFAVFHWVGNCFPPAIGLVFSVLLFQLFGHSKEAYLYLLPYMAVGFLAAKMLQQKRFHVFHWKTLLTLATMLTLVFGSIWIFQTDALGIVRYVPKASHVASVQVYVDRTRIIGATTTYSHENFTQQGQEVFIPEDIAMVTDVHSKLLSEQPEKNEKAMVYLTYKLKNGGLVRRYYRLPVPSAQFAQLDRAVSTPEAVFGSADWDTFVDQVYYISVQRPYEKRKLLFGAPELTADAASNDVKVNKSSMLPEFLERLKSACEKGNLSQLESTEYTVQIKSRDSRGREKTHWLSIPAFWSDAVTYIEFCMENGRTFPNRTITEDAVLTVFP